MFCTDLAYFDETAEKTNDVRYLLFVEACLIDAKRIETKDSTDTVGTFSTTITEKESTNENWCWQGTEYSEEFIKFCNADGIKNYSTMNKTNAAFAERTTQMSKYT